MPAEKEHIQLAIHNIKTTAYLLCEKEFSDWAATVTFYAALHIVETIFYCEKIPHGHKHETRESILKHTQKYANLWKHYRPLQSASTIARYCQDRDAQTVHFFDYMPPDTVKGVLIKHHFWQLIKSSEKFIGTDAFNLLKTAFQQHLQK